MIVICHNSTPACSGTIFHSGISWTKLGCFLHSRIHIVHAHTFHLETVRTMPTEDQPRPNCPTLPRQQRQSASMPQLFSNVHGGISRLVPIINPYDKLYHMYESRIQNNGTNPYARMYHKYKGLSLKDSRRQFQSRELKQKFVGVR
jgi:hypothetical protein